MSGEDRSSQSRDSEHAVTIKWGIPNWDDASSYGDTEAWSFPRWRWEFFRRREDLRASFLASADPSYRRWVHGAKQPKHSFAHAFWFLTHGAEEGRTEALEPDEPGFLAYISDEEKTLFGYSFLPNPRIGNQPEWAILMNEDDGTVKYLIGSDSLAISDLLAELHIELSETQRIALMPFLIMHPFPLGENEVAVAFDLRKPLSPQLDVAKGNLSRLQQNVAGKALQRRRHPQKWLSYLRTLDAREAGATWARIAEIHLATARTEQTARDIWEQANMLRCNF